MTVKEEKRCCDCHELKRLSQVDYSDRYDAESRFFISAPGKIKVFYNFYTLIHFLFNHKLFKGSKFCKLIL